MATSKILIAGLPNTGKTTVLQSLENVLVIARDGKKYPFPQAHVNVPDFVTAQELIDLIIEKINAYEEKLGKLPDTIVIDSLSKIVLDIEGNILARVKSFPYGEVNKEIKQVVDFIERDLAATFNIIVVSHALTDEEEGYKLVNAGGSWGKKGGFLSEVDQSIFIEVKGTKRKVHFRNHRLARTTLADLPDNLPLEEFSLKKHLDLLRSTQQDVEKFEI